MLQVWPFEAGATKAEAGRGPAAAERLQGARGRPAGAVKDDDERLRGGTTGCDEHLRRLPVLELNAVPTRAAGAARLGRGCLLLRASTAGRRDDQGDQSNST